MKEIIVQEIEYPSMWIGSIKGQQVIAQYLQRNAKEYSHATSVSIYEYETPKTPNEELLWNTWRQAETKKKIGRKKEILSSQNVKQKWENEDVTARPIHNRNLSSLVKYRLIYLDKKSIITRVYLRNSMYNQLCIQALLTPEQDRIFHANQLLNKILWMTWDWHSNTNSI